MQVLHRFNQQSRQVDRVGCQNPILAAGRSLTMAEFCPDLPKRLWHKTSVYFVKSFEY